MRYYLKNHSECWNFRQSNIMGLKLFDVMLCLNRDTLVYFDTDIFFLKRVDMQNVMDWKGPVFMEDCTNSYSLRPWNISVFGVQILSKICAGFTKFHLKDYDLDFIEWFLRRYKSSLVAKKRPYWIEQTCWAALAYRTKSTGVIGKPNFFFPDKYSTIKDLCQNDAIHFVSTYRDKLGLVKDEMCSNGEISKFEVKKAKNLGFFDFLKTEINRSYSR